MPIFLSRQIANPVPPSSIESPDGLLTVTAYPAGVYLVAEFADDQVRHVRFFRGSEPVRSGNVAEAPGGSARAFDMFAPVGQASTWYAQPIYRDGTEGPLTQGAAVAVPDVADGFDCWLKPVEQPELSAPFEMQIPDPEEGGDGRNTLSPIQGSDLPAGSWDVPTRTAWTFVFKTYTVDQFRSLQAILRSGPVMWQGLTLFGIVPFVGLPNSIRTAYFVGAYDPRRLTTVELQPVPEPTTLDAPLIIPGRSYDLLDQELDTYDQMGDIYSSYDAMVVPQ